MFLHCMYNAQMYAALHTDNSPNVYSKHSVLGLACESTFWLILMQPASVFCPGSACCPCCHENPFSSHESLDCGNRTHDKQNSLSRQVRKN